MYNTDGTAKGLMEIMTDLRAAYQDHTAEVGEVSAAVAQLDEQYAAGTITQE